MFKAFIICLSLILISSSVSVKTEQTPAVQIFDIYQEPAIYDPIQIKLLGDSISMGFGCTGYSPTGEAIFDERRTNETGHCYVNLFKKYYETNYNYKVKNWCISGITSDDLLKHIEKFIEPEDDIILFMIGANDCRSKKHKKTEKNIEGIIEYIQSFNKDIILLTCSPSTRVNIYGLDDVVNIQKQLAEEHDILCIDVYAEFIQYCSDNNLTLDSLLIDGLHPNDEGHTLIFNIIKDNVTL